MHCKNLGYIGRGVSFWLHNATHTTAPPPPQCDTKRELMRSVKSVARARRTSELLHRMSCTMRGYSHDRFSSNCTRGEHKSNTRTGKVTQKDRQQNTMRERGRAQRQVNKKQQSKHMANHSKGKADGHVCVVRTSCASKDMKPSIKFTSKGATALPSRINSRSSMSKWQRKVAVVESPAPPADASSAAASIKVSCSR